MPTVEIPAALLAFLNAGRQQQQRPLPQQRPQYANVQAQMLPQSQAPQLKMETLKALPLGQMPDYGGMAMREGAARRSEERQAEAAELQQAEALMALEREAQARREYYQDNPEYDPYHAMQNAPTQAGRDAAFKMMQDQQKPVTRAETPIELFKRDPGLYGQYKSHDKPLVTVDTGIKYPKGGMISTARQLNMGLPTTGRYWDKGDGSPPTKISNFSENEGKAAGFYHRMDNAGKSINKLAKKYDATAFKDNLTQVGMPQFLSNYASSLEGQQYSVAKRAWLEAHLRKESGAVIGKEEMANADSMYFPMPGDDKETIAVKNMARKAVEESTLAQSGGAYAELYPQAPKASKAVKRVSWKDYQ